MVDAITGLYLTYGNLLCIVGINALVGVSIYITLSAGQLSLANAAFMGIGAYGTVLVSRLLGLPFELSMIIAAMIGAVISALVGFPVLRLKAVYLAIATIGFGEVLKAVLVNVEFLGGALGFNGIPKSTTLLHVYGILLLVIVFLKRLQKTHVWRAWDAIREDEMVAKAMGIPTAYYKTLAFTIGMVVACLAGGLISHLRYAVQPSDFGFDQIVKFLMFTLVGGVGSVFGSIIGAALLTGLPEMLRFLGDYRLIVNGVILMLIMIYLPEGLISVKKDLLKRIKRRENNYALDGERG